MSLELAQWAGVAVPGALAAVAGIGWLWKVHHTADKALDGVNTIRAEREVDKAAFGKRLEQAEDKADAVTTLADAIRHQTEVFSLEIKSISDKQDIRNTYTNEQLADIKHEQKNMRLKVEALSLGAGGRVRRLAAEE
jgi:hypothetical protein